MQWLTRVCVILAVTALMFMCVSHAKIDPETAVGVWLLDEGSGDTAADISGNGNDGEFIGNPKWIDGKFGKALHFDGEDDMVPVGQNEVLRVSEGTMMNWINMQTANDIGLSSMTIPYDDGPAWDAPWRSFGLGTWQGQLRYWIAINDQNREIPPGNIEVDRWYHEAITFDGETRKAYLDGELAEAVEGPGKITYGKPTPTAVIGSASVEVPRELFNGYIDEIAIFNVALSEEDINEIIDNGLKGILAVDPKGKATTTWAAIKSE